jgi:hypothetical protein
MDERGRKFEILGIVDGITPEGYSVRAKKLHCANPRVLATEESMTMVMRYFVQRHWAEIAKLPPTERKMHAGYWWLDANFEG